MQVHAYVTLAEVGRLSIFLCFLALLPCAVGQTTAAHKSPDIFLITIDTLRADHVGCYGYQKIETPALDALCADGVHFTEAFTHSPITNTSHTTILTGLLPSAHGVTDFGVPLAPQHVTWAELLKKKGYQTAAFIGAVILDSKSLAPGLDRGFDFYDNFPAKTETKERWGRVERRGMEVVQHTESWLDKHRAGPRFVWVHLYDPHDPYEPPPPFAEKYKDRLYDGEIAYADSALAHLVAYLKRNGAYTNAVVIVVGDHGEGLGEHGEDTHGLFLYDSTLHVPLIIKLPGTTRAGTISDVQVRTTDILPTVLAVESIPAPPELTGESLLPLHKVTNQPGRALFAETDYPLRWGWASLRALRENNMKFIQAPRPELYDLSVDSQEQKNLYTADEPRVASLKSDIEKWESKLPDNPAAKNAMLADPKDKVQVQNLLHNAMLASDDNRSQDARNFLEKALQLDPKSPTALRQLGELEFAAGDFSKASAHLKQAFEIRPEDSTAAFELGQALEKSGDMAGARDALEASLKLVPSQIPARLLLGHVYLKLNDAKNAEDQFEAAQLVDSSNAEAQLGLAEAQIAQSKFAEALPDLEAYVNTHPQDPAALHLLARAYRGVGRITDAEKAESRASAARKE